MGVKLRLLKKGNQRFTNYDLLDYELDEVQEMINHVVENHSPLHLQYLKLGVERELEFNPDDYDRIEILQVEDE